MEKLLKNRGIYTRTRNGEKRSALVLINGDEIVEQTVYVYCYRIPICVNCARRDVEKILEDQIRFHELRFDNVLILRIDDFLVDVDGYLGQIDERMLDTIRHMIAYI